MKRIGVAGLGIGPLFGSSHLFRGPLGEPYGVGCGVTTHPNSFSLLQREPMPTRGTDRILVVDDDAHVLHNVKRMLERQGYVVATHDGGPGCSHEARRFKPDLVLVDLKMPFLSGDAYVSLLDKQAGTERPMVVLFSAIDEFTLEKTARSCGADGYISKSDSGLEFARKVAGFLRTSRTFRQRAAAES